MISSSASQIAFSAKVNASLAPVVIRISSGLTIMLFFS